ncbi:MAG: O-antigen ligase family protein [Planctomycetaceae bacterium]
MRCVDAGLFAAVFVLPFVMGGRQAIGEFTLISIASWTACSWFVHLSTSRTARWRFTGMEPLLAAGIALCLVQTLTVPPEFLESVSPHLKRLLPLWQTAHDAEAPLSFVPGGWSSISLVPAATRSSLCCVIAVAMLFIAASQRIETVADARLLIRSIAVSAALMAVFGCAQFLLGNGRFFGFYEHPFTHTRDYAKGAFTNPNHFANFLAMAVPILLAWYAMRPSGSHRRRQDPYPSLSERLTRLSGPLALAGLALVSIGILLSQSRGGLVTACIGAIVTLLLLLRQRLLSLATAGTIGGISVAALVSLSLFGTHIESLIERNFHELVSGDVQQLDRGDARQKIWAAALAGIADYPLLGTGLGTHREVYWTYFDHPDIDGEYSHAENGPLQLTLETGLVGIALAAAAWLLIGFWCCRGLWRKSPPAAGALLAAAAGVFAVNLVHSITDFVWYVPSCMTVIALLAACTSRLDRLTSARHPRPPSAATFATRSFGMAGAACLLLLSAWMVSVKHPALLAEPLWFDYIRMVHSTQKLDDAFDREEYQRHKLATVLAAAEADPDDCRMQMRAAAAALTMFHEERRAEPGSMSLANVREAARASEWESPQQLQDWLNKPGVIGDRTQLDEAWNRTQHALSLCPLLAEGYIRLAELAWLRGATRRQEDALLVQALLVRPFDPLVQFAAGREAWLRGKETAALDHWKRAFERDPEFQQLIIDLLSPAVPAQFLLDHFHPDAGALSRLRDAYRGSHDPDGFLTVARLLAERLSQEAAAARHHDAVNLWRKAHEAYAELDDAPQARLTAEAAVNADPNSYAARLLLGRWLYKAQEYAAARAHLEFCHHRHPQDKNLQAMLEIATRRAQDPAVAPRVAVEAGSPSPPRRL